MARIKRLTPKMLRNMVLQEKKRVRETLELGQEEVEKAAAKTPEVDADDQANTLEKDVDFLKVLKIQERKCAVKLRRIQEAKVQLKKRILRKL